MPQESTEQTGSDITVSTRQLNESELTPVYISEVDDPELLFVIRTDQHDRLVTLVLLIQEIDEQVNKYLCHDTKLSKLSNDQTSKNITS